MADAATAHYKLTQPEVGAAQNTWGGSLNADLVDIDELLYNRVVKNQSGKDAAITSNVPQEMGLWLKLPPQPRAPVGADTIYFTANTAATMGWVEHRIMSLLDAVFQIGTIIMWSGTIQQWADIMAPHGWYFCNGSNNTPNLQDRIVLAAGAYHPPGQKGVEDASLYYGLGLHTHALTNNIAMGYAGSTEFQDDFGGAALYQAANGVNQAYLPYYSVCYLMKIRGFSG